jgi:hypothetical protein
MKGAGSVSLTPQEIPDDAELTQFGEMGEGGAVFRNKIRPEIGETDMSLMLGRVDADTASRRIRRIVVPNAMARYATASAFRSKGFIVAHTPTKKKAYHVSVFAPLENDRPREWDNDLAKLFDSCFTEEGGGTGG